MRNPSRTQHNSIFEPLFSQEQVLHSPPSHLMPSSSSEWLSSTYSASDKKIFFPNCQLRKAPTTIFNKEMITNQINGGSEQCNPTGCDHGKPSRSTTDAPTYCTPPSRSLSMRNVDKELDDDGSVASKLLSSITKSISSPSLLACCKESVRETPYQKTLKLRAMNLHHCAEELGSESSGSNLMYSDADGNSSFDSLATAKSSFNSFSQSSSPRSSLGRSFSSTIMGTDRTSDWDASPKMISVRSAPNLRCPSLMKERSFPPPLTHTLPRSASSDSFALSLRAYREDGRFVLKEVKVPCRTYFQASRRDGRLTLQLFTSDESVEEEGSVLEDVNESPQAEGDLSAACDKEEDYFDHHIWGDDGKTCGVENLQDSVDLNANAVQQRTLTAKSLLMATLHADNIGMIDGISHFATPPSNSLGLKAISPLLKMTQCEEDMILQSRSMRNTSDTSDIKNMVHPEVSSPSLRRARFGMERSMSSTFIFKDVGANSWMEDVTKLQVKSFGLDSGGKWCQGKMDQYSRKLERSGFSSRSVDKSISINFEVRKVDKNGAHVEGNGVQILNVECERKQHRIADDEFNKEGGWENTNTGTDLSRKSTALRFDVDWSYSFHCKELSGFAKKGFPCVAIRS